VIEPYEPTYTDTHVKAVSCYHNLVFIRKGDNREGTRKRRTLKDRYADEDPQATRAPDPT
jgi:demethylmacrocin O-methyltransferase